MTKTIFLKKYLGKTGGTRQHVRALKEKLSTLDGNEFFLDFSNMSFISRSTAHELLLLKEELNFLKQKKIYFKTAIPFIEKMFRVVAFSRLFPKKITIKIKKIRPEAFFKKTKG